MTVASKVKAKLAAERRFRQKDGPRVLLSLWLVEASSESGERRVVVQPIAVKQDGTRVPTAERQCERYLQAPTTTPTFSPEQRIDIFTRVVEPALQRELKHKGTADGDGSYSAELIGYVEILSNSVKHISRGSDQKQ